MKVSFSKKSNKVSKPLLVATVITAAVASWQGHATALHTNIATITEQKLTPDFWISQLESPNKTLLDTTKIEAMNQAQFEREDYLKHPLSYPDKLSKVQVSKLITKVSKKPTAQRFYVDGKKLTDADFNRYIDSLALEQIANEVGVKFALVTQRTSLRTFPTLDRVLNRGMDADLDRFQETALFPGEPIAVLHTSRDGKWHFVQNYHYRAWVQSNDIAFADRQTVKAFDSSVNKLVVTGAKVKTNFNPENTETSEVQLDMGTQLPLVSHQELNDFSLKGQNPYASHIVKLPTRDDNGNLKLEPTLIARSADVSVGVIPMTPANIIGQGFKFLGERYGWGHDYNARDCTGFVGEIHKSFGLLLPRNSGQQGKDSIGSNIRFEKNTPMEKKLKALNDLEVGDLIYLPGHVAMVIGYDQGEPYIIHSVKGLNYANEQGQKVTGTLNGVSVTPLLPFKSYIRGMYNIKRLR